MGWTARKVDGFHKVAKQVLSGTLAQPLLVHADLPSSSLASPRVRAGGCTDEWTKHCVNRGLRISEMKWPLLELGKKLEQRNPSPLNPEMPCLPPLSPTAL